MTLCCEYWARGRAQLQAVFGNCHRQVSSGPYPFGVVVNGLALAHKTPTSARDLHLKLILKAAGRVGQWSQQETLHVASLELPVPFS